MDHVKIKIVSHQTRDVSLINNGGTSTRYEQTGFWYLQFFFFGLAVLT